MNSKHINVYGARTLMLQDCCYDLISSSRHFISSVNSLNHEDKILSIGGYQIDGVKAKGTQYPIDPNLLSKRWNIPLEMAKRTLRVTSQFAMRTTENPSLKNASLFQIEYEYIHGYNVCFFKDRKKYKRQHHMSSLCH